MDVSVRDAIGPRLHVQVFRLVFLSYRTSYLFKLLFCVSPWIEIFRLHFDFYSQQEFVGEFHEVNQGVTNLKIPQNS